MNPVKSGMRALWYYVENIDGVDYIRPASMFMHDSGYQSGANDGEKEFIKQCSAASEALKKGYEAIAFNKKGLKDDFINNELETEALYNDMLRFIYGSLFTDTDLNAVDYLYNENEEKDYPDRYIRPAVYQLLIIGELLKNKSFEQIGNYDGWKDSEKKKVQEAVLYFAKHYGLLGLLNEVFVGMNKYDTNANDVESLNVSTYIRTMYISVVDIFSDLSMRDDTTMSEFFKLPFSFKEANESGKRTFLNRMSDDIFKIQPPIPIDYTMNIMKYIKIFFPTNLFMFYYDQYRKMDELYWVGYSEPMFLFLLAAKLFYLEFMYMAKAKGSKKNKPDLETYMRPMDTSIVIGFDSEPKVKTFVQFPSTYNALKYMALSDIMANRQYIVVCPWCGIVEESTEYSKIFHNDKCSAHERVTRARDNEIKKTYAKLHSIRESKKERERQSFKLLDEFISKNYLIDDNGKFIPLNRK